MLDLPVEDGGGGGPPETPPTSSGDWARIADFVAGFTEAKLVNFSHLNTSEVVDFAGEYTLLGVTALELLLDSPSTVSSAWDALETSPGVYTETAYASPWIATTGVNWVGPFTIQLNDMNQVLSNYIASQGLYEVSKKGSQHGITKRVELELTPVDVNGDPTGPAETFIQSLSGTDFSKDQVAVSQWATPSFTGRCQVRARRLDGQNPDKDVTKVDEIKWRDCYGVAPITDPDFGDVTTVHTRTYATSGATSQKERKFNARVTRRVLVRNEDDTFGPTLAGSTNAADIICHMALDPFIGGRQVWELDVPQIYDTIEQVKDYFGIDVAGQFCYTFDQKGVSFEEMVQTVAAAVFCTAYRQGSKLRLFFEKLTDDSSILFNHRNKAPGSETRTITFSNFNDYDGVELDYVSPDDGAKLTLYAPEDQSATKPRKVEYFGVQDVRQATLLLMREWNKIRYQNTTTEFKGTAEASTLIRNERIEVADNTRADVFDGQVLTQDGLVLYLSQPFVPVDGFDYVIHLQLSNGTVEVIDIVPGADDRHIVLQAPPSVALVLDQNAWANTLYQIVGSGDVRTSAFLVSEKGAFDNVNVTVQAINYDPRYYGADDTYRT